MLVLKQETIFVCVWFIKTSLFSDHTLTLSPSFFTSFNTQGSMYALTHECTHIHTYGFALKKIDSDRFDFVKLILANIDFELK
jgi:hypothetical protein